MGESVVLSLVVLNHNSGRMLHDCLASFFASPLPFSTEVIVVDNASTDTSLAMVEQRWPDRARVMRNRDNRGFAWGNNIGIRASAGRYVCLLNPDTVVRPGAFADLIAFMERTPRAGFCGPKVLNPDGSLQLSARRSIPSPADAVYRALLLSRLFPRSARFAKYNLTYISAEHDQQVDACTGCCMVVRRQMLDQIGLLDERFFLYCEDVDWFLRAKRAGWEVWYVARAVIEHHDAYSTRFRRYRAVADFHRSMIYFYRKHYAAEHLQLYNWVIHGLVRMRMLAVMCIRSVRGWR